jgi:hypothetical protein
MKLKRLVLGLTVILMTVTVAMLPATQLSIVLGLGEDVQFGPLINAPNGHISFQKDRDGYKIWLPGRLETATLNQEGGFLFNVPRWTLTDLAQGQPTFALGPEAPLVCDSTDMHFDRDYAAMNAVVPGAEANRLLAFYDAEYHVNCPNGQPLLSSIGLATSTDGGVTWQKQDQIIQGLDEAVNGFSFVTQRQLAEANNGNDKFDVGASGPSAVIRDDNGAAFLYLYYSDRTPITGSKSSVYVARALLATDGTPGTWQKWTGAGWGVAGDQTSAAPIVTPPSGTGVALQPHVSRNTALRSWLMVFKTQIDFEVAQSDDGLHWTTPTSLLTFASTDRDTGFPSLISPDAGECQAFWCDGDDDAGAWWLLHGATSASQQVTGAVGWLFYSSVPQHATQYVGHRVPFRVTGS